MKPTAPMRVCMLGAFEPDSPRQQVIRTGLEQHGVTVTNVRLWRKTNTIRQALRMVRRWREVRDCDVIFVPAFCELFAPFAWALGIALRKPVVLDYMVGLMDGVVEERNEQSRLKRVIYRQVDRFNLRRMTTLTDTAAHIDIFAALTGVRPRKMSVVPVGVNDAYFRPQPEPDTQPDAGSAPLLVQFFGSYIPFHGVDVLLDAISVFRDDPRVRFELI